MPAATDTATAEATAMEAATDMATDTVAAAHLVPHEKAGENA